VSLRSQYAMAGLGLFLMLPMLSGCGLQDWFDAMDRQQFEHACANLGIARGTPSWDQCMIQQQASAKNEEQQFLNRVHEREMVRELNHRR